MENNVIQKVKMIKKITLILYFSIALLSTSSVVAQCWQMIAPNSRFSAGIQTDGTLWTWGENLSGELGNGTLLGQLYPVQVGTDSDWSYVSCGNQFAYAIKNDGTLWSWGNNTNGELSDGTTTSKLLPTQVLPGTTWIKVSASNKFVIAQKSDGTLWSCGLNINYQLGFSDNLDRHVLTQINSDDDWLTFGTGFSHVVLLKTNHKAWGIGGWNCGGCLLSGSNIGYTAPTQLMSSDWEQITEGEESTFFKKANGTIYAIGENSHGCLGIGSTNWATFNLLQVGTASDWLSVESSRLYTMALKTNGTLWATGLNGTGQLGLGNTSYTNVFTQVGTANNWAKVRCGILHTLALDTNGTLWAWGGNSYGQLGDATTTNRLVPTQIGTPCTLNTTNFKKASVRLVTNPVENIVQLSFDSDGAKKIEVYNVYGVLINAKTISDDFISFDVSVYESGVYFIKCSMGDTLMETVKVIKR